jgi:UDP-glucose 4-epimerase
MTSAVPVLVTGASGFIGSALVASLRGSGHEVLGIDLVPSRDPDLELMVGDIQDPAVVESAFARPPGAVFHLAARTSVLRSIDDPQGVYGVNVAATQLLLEASRRHGVGAFVLASTNAVAGDATVGRIDERTPLRPLTPYGATKAAGEMLCSAYAGAYGMAASAVRLTNIYGPGMGGKDTFVVRLLRAAASDTPATIYGDGRQERDYLYVDDAVAGLRLACDQAWSGPLTLGTEVSTSVLELCRLAGEAVGRPIGETGVPAPEGEMRAVRVDTSQARSLGFETRVALPEGLRRTWEALHSELSP